MVSKSMIAAVAATLFTASNAHFFISTPEPIPGSNSKSPLEASGSNFPCQGADLTKGTVTNMAVGSQQPLKFELGGGANWAVHGGGTCQVSLTYETDAAKQKDPKNWHVIHSWVGGCPTNAPLNLDPTVIACTGSDSTKCVTQDFTFTIPPEVKSGNAILGWTWFNNIGNREMYMNCARVAITGGSGDPSTLPALFTANIGNGCSTTEQFNTDVPNPGKYVTKDAKLNYPLKAPTGSCGSGSGSASVPDTPSSGSGSGTGSSGATPSSSGSGSSPSGSSSGSAPKSSPSSTSGGKGGKGGNGGTFAEGSPSDTPAASTPSAPAAAPASGSSSGSGSCANGAVPCSASGFYCISATKFGECAYGCAVPMAMAAGTSCTNNAVAHAVANKRSFSFFHRS